MAGIVVKQQSLNHITIVAAKPATQRPITIAHSHPNNFNGNDTVKSPITRLLLAIIIMRTMIGATVTPLITALQYKALIGSTGRKFSMEPRIVAKASVP
jgi:hypothetical protein